MALLIQNMTYNQIGAYLVSGQLTEKDLIRYYRQMRRTAKSRIYSIERAAREDSSLGFVRGEKPVFPRVEQFRTTSDLVAAVSDLNAFIGSRYSLTKQREKSVKKKLETLHEHKFDFVDEGNFLQWANFMKWFKASEWAAEYDSNGERVQEAFETLQGATSLEWNALFRKWKEEDEAKKNGG